MGYQAILCPISDRIISRIKDFYHISQSSVDTSAYYWIRKKIQFSSVWPGRKTDEENKMTNEASY